MGSLGLPGDALGTFSWSRFGANIDTWWFLPQFYEAFLRVGVTKYQFLHQTVTKMNAAADPPDPPETVAASAAQTLTSPRAKGQDYGS